MTGNRNKYILIGIPGAGKSTLGRRAADALQMPFFDTDKMAYERLGIRNPLDHFRAVFNGSIMMAQRNVVYELAELDSNAIIATGAEVALMPDCAAKLRRMGSVIHIHREPEILLAGIANDSRQLILQESDGTEIVMQAESVKRYAQEISQYEALANLTVENSGSDDDGLEKLVALINQQQTCV
jgi:shikimate kinase